MHEKRWIAALSLLLLGITVKPGRADAFQPGAPAPPAPVRDAWADRELTLSAQLGIGSPGGLLGMELESAPARWLALGAGAGPTVMGNLDGGYQIGIWVAPRWIVSSSSALGADLGVSGGPYKERAFMDEHGPWKSFRFAEWFNAAVRYQYLSQDGLSFRAFLGAASLLNPSSGYCSDGYEDEECPTIVNPYGGLALGYAFDAR